MKKSFVTIAMISALVACSTPMTSYAADVTVMKKGNCYVVTGGQGCDSLQQAVKDICDSLGCNTYVCPQIPSAPAEPGTGAGSNCQRSVKLLRPGCQTQAEAPNPEPQTPEASGSETKEQAAKGQSEGKKPETPAQPEGQKPEAPARPEEQKPETPAEPEKQEPEVPDGQDTEQKEEPENNAHFYAAQVLDLVNEERAKAGLSALTLDLKITAAANVRAKEIKRQFSHTRPDGRSFSTALTDQGISYHRSGENIAWGQRTPKEVMNGWMNSDGHRANILNANYRKLGVGYYQDENGRNHWVQLFTD